jgi:two-component system, cell cycle sensor histidine kinase and response regulator CckA
MVLVIDDEQALRKVLAEILAIGGISALCVGSGEEGVALFLEQRTQIKTVFLDLHLPRMGGHATFRALRELAPTLHIIIMSGQPEYLTIAEFSGQEHLSYLEKPFTLDLLMAKVNNVFDTSA